MPTSLNPYPESYYKTGNYHDYLDRAKRYHSMADEIVKWLGRDIFFQGPVLDYGCGAGFFVEGLRKLGIEAYGVDISKWIVDYAKSIGNRYVHHYLECLVTSQINVMCAFDVFEHFYLIHSIGPTISWIFTPKHLLVRIPVSEVDNGRYILDCSERDPTHKIRLTKNSWQDLFEECGYREKYRPNLKHYYDSKGVYCAYLVREE